MVLRRYKKKAGTPVAAVQVDLDVDSFTYRKWGGTQTCKRGDWLLCNDGDTYTVDREVFERTYRRVSLGVYEKITPVWAEIAEGDGKIETKEGATHYQAGAYLVYNDPDRKDGYAVNPEKFKNLYEPDD